VTTLQLTMTPDSRHLTLGRTRKRSRILVAWRPFRSLPGSSDFGVNMVDMVGGEEGGVPGLKEVTQMKLGERGQAGRMTSELTLNNVKGPTKGPS
jgi:hypothetical protein